MAFTRVVDGVHVEIFVAIANRISVKVSSCFRYEIAMAESTIMWVVGVY